MESILTLQELQRRDAKKDRQDRLARVKALTTEGLKAKPLAKKRGGGRVRAKGGFSPY
jgi:hypothetical protein